jgi:predicted ATP-binding protein involved in virulence
MRIDRIQIKNFKCFEDETFHLDSRFTVFIGDNAKGKTSVLDALAIAAGSFLRGIDVARQEARSIEKSEIRNISIDNQPRPQLPVVIAAFGEVGGKEIKDGWYRNVDKISPKTTTRYAGAKNIEKVASDMLQESRIKGGVTFPVLAYHGTGRLWAQHEEKRKTVYRQEGEGVERAYANCLSPKSSSKEFLSWYKTYEDEIRKFGLETEKLFLETFNNCIMSMIPERHWEEMAFSFKDDDLAGIFTTPEGRREKRLFSQLSDGYRNMIGMVADIAYRCIKLNPHLGVNAIVETPGIILIDELDLHLHPNWQRRIVNDLKNAFPKIQFVATTHSPFIVQSLRTEELRILDQDISKDGHPFRKSLEEVAAGEMGVEDIPRSAEFLAMQEAAEEYFRLIGQGKTSDSDEKTQQLRTRLNELEEKFAEDPAFVAALKIERSAKGAV